MDPCGIYFMLLISWDLKGRCFSLTDYRGFVINFLFLKFKLQFFLSNKEKELEPWINNFSYPIIKSWSEPGIWNNYVDNWILNQLLILIESPIIEPIKRICWIIYIHLGSEANDVKHFLGIALPVLQKLSILTENVLLCQDTINLR